MRPRDINRPLEKKRSMQKEIRFIDRKTHKETEKKNTLVSEKGEDMEQYLNVF